MLSKVQRWGNSQGLRLPRHILENANIEVGDNVEVVAQRNRIGVKKATKQKFDLAEMVARMPRDYKAHEHSFGPPVGKEEW